MIEWVERAAKLDGSFAEIGLGVGETTLKLLEFKKMVYGVDPFEDGWGEMPKSYGNPYRFEDFSKKVQDYTNFKLLKVNSLSYEAEQFLSVPLALAFVDGLQYKGAVLNDLRIVSHAEIIIVDDFNRSTGISQVPQAIEEYLKTNKRTLINKDRWAVLIK
jgi:hypothetical protein